MRHAASFRPETHDSQLTTEGNPASPRRQISSERAFIVLRVVQFVGEHAGTIRAADGHCGLYFPVRRLKLPARLDLPHRSVFERHVLAVVAHRANEMTWAEGRVCRLQRRFARQL